MSSDPADDWAQRAAEATGVALILVNADAEIIYVNGSGEALFERSHRHLEGAPLAQFGALGVHAARLADRAVTEQRSVVAHGLHLATAAGPRAVSFNAEPEGQGACIAIRCAPQDVTAAASEEAALAATGFGRMLSHELKNPLAGARGAAQLLAEGANGETGELAALIIGEIDRAGRIAERWSRSGDIAPQPFAPVNLNALVHAAAASARACQARRQARGDLYMRKH